MNKFALSGLLTIFVLFMQSSDAIGQCPSNKYQVESISGIGFYNSDEFLYKANVGSLRPPVDVSFVDYSTLRFFLFNRLAFGLTTIETHESGSVKSTQAGLLLHEYDNDLTSWDFDLELYYVYGFMKYFEAYTIIGAGPEISRSVVANTYALYPANNLQEVSNTSSLRFYYVPLGIRVGGRFAGFLQFGYGSLGMWSGGLSYKFGAPCWWRN